MGTQNTIIPTTLPSFPWNAGDKLDAVPLNNQFIAQQNQIDSLQTQVGVLQQNNSSSVTVNWAAGTITQAGTYIVSATAPFAMTINSIDTSVGTTGGSFSASVQINGTSVGGLNAVAVNNAAKTNTPATGANAVLAGAMVALVISNVSGTPSGGFVCLNATSA